MRKVSLVRKFALLSAALVEHEGRSLGSGEAVQREIVDFAREGENVKTGTVHVFDGDIIGLLLGGVSLAVQMRVADAHGVNAATVHVL